MLLSEKEILWILEVKNRAKEELYNKEPSNSISIIKFNEYYEKRIKEQISDFKYDLKNMDRRTEIVDLIIGSSGDINNIKNKCPVCRSQYVLELVCGDVFYRAFNAPKEKKDKILKKINQRPLFINIGACVGDYPYDFCCL